MAAAITAITGAIDFSTVITGLGVVFGALAGVYIVMKGGGMLLSAVRGK